MAYKAVIAGASGLIGSNLVRLLLQQPEYDEILILVRKELPISHPKLIQVVTDFGALDKYADIVNGHALFCCLGTTKSKTPDEKTYRKIDHDYPVQLAQLAASNNVGQYHLVSSIGADANSSQFYLKTKGETERDVQDAAVNCLHIYRPSFLTGDRHEARLGEKIAGAVLFIINPLLLGSLKKYRSMHGKTVAQAMVNQSLKTQKGVFIHTSDKIKELA